jgi:iron complex transport system ATP-binding protein
MLQTPPIDLNDAHAYLVEKLHFRYPGHDGSRAGRTVLEEVSFAVPTGEMLGIIGPNGAGKSTLLRCLAGIARPTGGRVNLFGSGLLGISRQDIARLIAYVPQDLSMPFSFSVRDVVLMGRFPHRSAHRWGLPGWDRSEDYDRAAQALSDLELIDLADRLLDELSAGERQRAYLARALAQESRILLLDEPTAFLDLHHQLEICRILRRIRRDKQLTIVMVSHDLNLAGQYCDRLLLLAGGRAVGPERPVSVLQATTLTAAYGCPVLVDIHPETGHPRIGLPGPAQ